MSELDNLLASMRKSSRDDPLRCWKRILANPSAYPFISVKMAKDVMEKYGKHREPGDDDEALPEV